MIRTVKKVPRGWPKGKWSKQALRVLKERYLWKNNKGKIIETPEGMIYRVAQEAAQGQKSWLKRFYRAMVDKDFLPNSPTLMNAGKGNDLQYSACFVIPVIDSIGGIFGAIERAALIHKSGGGTGFSFSSLRPSGAIVGSTGGIASGPVSFMRVFDSATNEIKQGGTRRGANMGVLRVDHPDILEFIECKVSGGITNFNISIAITDEFMEALKKNKKYYLRAQPGWPKPRGGKYKGGEKIGKLSAKGVFDKIVEAAWKTGDPGVIWLDKVNDSPANPVPKMGPIEATNPCLVGSTLISTDKGLVRLKDIVDKKLTVRVLTDNRVLNKKGHQYRPITESWNNGRKEIWQLETKSGFKLKGTADHKIFTQRGWISLGELKIGQDKIFLQAGEGQFGQKKKLPFKVQNERRGKNGQRYQFNFPQEWSKQLGWVLGWLIGDGWLRRDEKDSRVGFTFSEENKLVMKKIKSIVNNWYGRKIVAIKRENGVWHLSYHSKYLIEFFERLGVKPVKAAQKQVPETIFTAPKEAVIGFLQGLFTADGTVGLQLKNRSKYIRLTSKSPLLLEQVQSLLLNLGIFSRIYNRCRPPRRVFPYITKAGERKGYLTDGICFELNIGRTGMEDFIKKIGFLENRHQDNLVKAATISSYSQKFMDLVVGVKNTGKQETVYDLSVSGINSFFAHGLIVHNCGEQPLYPNEACNLGSINLANMVEGKKINWSRLKETIQLAVRFLDNIIDVNPLPFKEITKAVLSNRRIGLGVMGWVDMLFELEIPYDSSEAVSLARKVMKFVDKWAWKASEELAEKRGPFPNFKKSIYGNGKPRRNATVTTIAPTGSISIIAGCSSGIEPAFALAYTHRTNGRVLDFINPVFEKKALNYRHGREIIKAVKKSGFLTEVKAPKKLKNIFKTAHEIQWRWHIRTQAAFQKHVDNAVSKTINLSSSAKKEEVRKAYLFSYKAGCRGVTVFRDGCKGEQVLNAGEEKEKPIKGRKVEVSVKPRPQAVKGFTYRVATPVGTAFVTINHNGHTDHPLEVFVNVGKAGSDVAADAEAIGRLISLCLRISSPGLTPRQVAELIVDQLKGIGGGSSVGFGKKRVRSLADGLAYVIKQHLLNGSNSDQGKTKVSLIGQQTTMAGLEKGSEKTIGDICPNCGHASLIYEEGCSKCFNCGFSKC